MGQVQLKDGTAQGVAKIRHYEALHEPSKRLYHDPYAHAMYPGSFVQTWLGERGTHRLYSLIGLPGLLECLTIRTKWLDDQVLEATTQDNGGGGAQQLVILGAGYDTRGFRLLDLPQNNDFVVFEVDQHEVQAKKIQKLQQLIKNNEKGIATRMGSFVKFIPIDFNDADSSIDEILRQAEGYSIEKQTVVTMEGVTQYIPKESTADTLKRLKKVMPPGSKLLITYVDQNCFDDPAKCGPAEVVERVSKITNRTAEPWISCWSSCDDEFHSFLDGLGYKVLSDTTARDYVDQYLVPLDRGMKEEEMLCMERYVVASIKET